MKTCNTCNVIYPDNKNFCTKCGAPLVTDGNFEKNQFKTQITFSDRLQLFLKRNKGNLFSLFIGMIVYVSFFLTWLSSNNIWNSSAYDLVKNEFLIIFNQKYEHWILDFIFLVTLFILPIIGINLFVQSIRQIFKMNNSQTYSVAITIVSLTILFLSKFEPNFMLFFGVTMFLWSILIMVFESKYGLKNGTMKSYLSVSKIVIIIYLCLLLIVLLYLQFNAPIGQIINLFKCLGIGFYVFLFSVLLTVIDLFTFQKHFKK